MFSVDFYKKMWYNNAILIEGDPAMQFPKGVLYLLEQLNQNDYAAYIVGGSVRDMQSGVIPSDYDIATSATPDEVKAVFQHLRVIDTGLKHGTVTVLYNDLPYEITTFRIESSYSDGRHPDNVSFTADITKDLARRDFTINAMAYHPDIGLIDPFGGREDLERKCLRCVGLPYERFSEDPLRIMRLLRFASVLGYSVDEQTEQAAFALCERLSLVSVERLAVELSKMLLGASAKEVLIRYIDILSVFAPELHLMKSFDQCNPHHVYDVLTHTAVMLDHLPPVLPLRLAALLHDAGKPQTFSLDEDGVGHFYGHAEVSAMLAESFLERLKFDNVTRSTVLRLVKWHDLIIEPTDKAIKRVLGRMTPDFLRMLLLLKRADNLAQAPLYRTRLVTYDEIEMRMEKILAERACFSLKDLAIRGNDLIAAGLEKGKVIGETLSLLLDKVISNELSNDKETLLQFAKDYHNLT